MADTDKVLAWHEFFGRAAREEMTLMQVFFNLRPRRAWHSRHAMGQISRSLCSGPLMQLAFRENSRSLVQKPVVPGGGVRDFKVKLVPVWYPSNPRIFR